MGRVWGEKGPGAGTEGPRDGGGPGVPAELAEQLAGEAEGKDEYEIQELARAKCARDMEMSKLRASLCRKAAFRHGLKLDQVTGVLGLELRDILLKKAAVSAPE